jgi:hypothetical protein
MDLEAARQEFVQHVCASPEERRTEWQLDYVRLIVMQQELASLQRHGAWLAVVSAKLTSALLGHSASATAINSGLVDLEIEKRISVDEARVWRARQGEFPAYLEKLKDLEQIR